MKDLKAIIGNRIRYLRNSLNLSQQEFVDKLNLNIVRGHISSIELGKNMPSAEFIKAVCTQFNVSPYWLLDIPKGDITPMDPIFERYTLLDEDSQKVIIDLIRILLNNTK